MILYTYNQPRQPRAITYDKATTCLESVIIVSSGGSLGYTDCVYLVD